MGEHERITTVIATEEQITMTKAICDQRHWPPGNRLTVNDTPDGVLMRQVVLFPSTAIEAAFGCLRHDGPALSIEHMNAAIDREAKRRKRD